MGAAEGGRATPQIAAATHPAPEGVPAFAVMARENSPRGPAGEENPPSGTLARAGIPRRSEPRREPSMVGAVARRWGGTRRNRAERATTTGTPAHRPIRSRSFGGNRPVNAGEFFGACAQPRGDAVGPAGLDRQEPAVELDDAAIENRRFGRGDLDLQAERMGGEQLGDPKPAISNAAVTLSA